MMPMSAFMLLEGDNKEMEIWTIVWDFVSSLSGWGVGVVSFILPKTKKAQKLKEVKD